MRVERVLDLNRSGLNLYERVRSNNRSNSLVHYVRSIVSVDGSFIIVKLLCGNSIGTQRKVSFVKSYSHQECNRCKLVKDKKL